MIRIFTILSMLFFALNISAQSTPQKASAMTLAADNAMAVYTGSSTGEFGNWTLVLADGEQVVANIDIFANSAKRLAGTYTFDNATITSGTVFLDGAEEPLGAGNFQVAYVGKGSSYPIYHIEGELQSVSGNTFLLNTDLELLAYDYLYFTYYEMGLIDFDMCVVQLQDAPDEDTGVVVEMDFVGGNWEIYDDMGILKVTAETADSRYTQLLFDAVEVKSGSYVINDLYASRCYIANLEDHTYEAYFKSGTAEITVTDDGILSLTARMKAKNDDDYILRIPLAVREGKDYHNYLGINAPAINTPTLNRPTKTLRKGRVTIESHGRTFSTNGVRQR